MSLSLSLSPSFIIVFVTAVSHALVVTPRAAGRCRDRYFGHLVGHVFVNGVAVDVTSASFNFFLLLRSLRVDVSVIEGLSQVSLTSTGVTAAKQSLLQLAAKVCAVCLVSASCERARARANVCERVVCTRASMYGSVCEREQVMWALCISASDFCSAAFVPFHPNVERVRCCSFSV
jgi:hypothetical protein